MAGTPGNGSPAPLRRRLKAGQANSVPDSPPDSPPDRGLPGGADHEVGKIAVGIAPSDPDRWYALVEDESPGFYRSDDGGDSWRLTLTHHDLAERAPYYVRFAVDSGDADRIYFASVLFATSVDGGRSLVETSYRAGGDNHDVWVDPLLPGRILVAHDGRAAASPRTGAPPTAGSSCRWPRCTR